MQKFLGNVVVSSPNTKLDKCFKKCLSLSEIDKNLPTLIIGLQNAKKYIDNFSILKKNYDNDMLWWTFTKMERRVDNDKDTDDFKKICINNIVNSINYKNISIINLDTRDKIRRCVNFVKNDKKKYYYIDNNKFIFLYDKENGDKGKNIYGFSLNTAAFFGISKKKVIKLLEENDKNIQIKNFYSIPNNIRRIVNDEIPKEMVLNEYFL
jgi:hypothetical protein